jgi:hypothetical protein
MWPILLWQEIDNRKGRNNMPKPDEKNDVTNDNTTIEDAKDNNGDATDNADNASKNTQPTPEYVTVEAFNEMKDTISSFKETMDTIMGGIKSIRDAQGVMVRAGMVVQDDSDPEPVDDFKPLSELDFSVKR